MISTAGFRPAPSTRCTALDHRVMISGAIGSCIHVAMAAGLVALLADVDLEDVDPGGRSGNSPASASAASKLRASGTTRAGGAGAPSRADAAASRSVGAERASSHAQSARAVAHLHAVHQRSAAADGRGHVDRLRHLLHVGALSRAEVVKASMQ